MLLQWLRVGLLTMSMLALGIGLWQPIGVSQQPTGEPTEFHIHMGEFFFQVEGQPQGTPIEVEAGKTYMLQFHIDGKIQHEAMIGDPTQLRMEDGMAHGYVNNLFDGVTLKLMGTIKDREFQVEVMGLMEIDLKQDQLLEVEFTLPEGKKGQWEIGCFLGGHYEAGMKIPLIVK